MFMIRTRISRLAPRSVQTSLNGRNYNEYFTAKFLIFGTGIVGSLFMLSAILVYVFSSVLTSMYVLITGIAFIIMMIFGIKILTFKWQSFVEELEEVLQQARSSGEVNWEVVDEKPPQYNDVIKDEELPPTYEQAMASLQTH